MEASYAASFLRLYGLLRGAYDSYGPRLRAGPAAFRFLEAVAEPRTVTMRTPPGSSFLRRRLHVHSMGVGEDLLAPFAQVRDELVLRHQAPARCRNTSSSRSRAPKRDRAARVQRSDAPTVRTRDERAVAQQSRAAARLPRGKRARRATPAREIERLRKVSSAPASSPRTRSLTASSAVRSSTGMRESRVRRRLRTRGRTSWAADVQDQQIESSARARCRPPRRCAPRRPRAD